jgi:hypothetical protein
VAKWRKGRQAMLRTSNQAATPAELASLEAPLTALFPAPSSGPEQVSSVLFTDVSQLLSLGEQTGLASSTRLRALLEDLAKVRTIGLSSISGASDTTTELRLEIP